MGWCSYQSTNIETGNRYKMSVSTRWMEKNTSVVDLKLTQTIRSFIHLFWWTITQAWIFWIPALFIFCFVAFLWLTYGVTVKASMCIKNRSYFCWTAPVNPAPRMEGKIPVFRLIQVCSDVIGNLANLPRYMCFETVPELEQNELNIWKKWKGKWMNNWRGAPLNGLMQNQA